MFVDRASNDNEMANIIMSRSGYNDGSNPFYKSGLLSSAHATFIAFQFKILFNEVK